MHYSITKKITARRSQTAGRGVVGSLIALIGVPVVIIALLSFVVFTVLAVIVQILYFPFKLLFAKKKTALPPESFYVELELLNTPEIKILAIEDETDKELAILDESWSEETHHYETYLYRAKTNPLVPVIDGKIIGFYMKEQPDGVILQLLSDTYQDEQFADTQLVYLRYSDLKVVPIDNIGLFHLYNDEVERDLIRGFNNNEKIKIYLDRIEDA